jgi:predicted acetyltransferase
MTEFADAPIDQASAASLSTNGLRLALVDTSDSAGFETWLRADYRGFHGPEASAETIAHYVTGLADRRTTGVWDDSTLDPTMPVATVSSWTVDMTVPGRRTVEAWAISSVTVAPTHRRTGIARALLEGELRTAHRRGIPMATLTVSESTIYGRFGFAPAAFAANLDIDTKRAKWTGPTPSGRVNFISTARFRTEVAAMHERVRLDSPGQIPAWDLRWDQLAGLADDDKSKGADLRSVRYDDADGQPRGVALYRVSENEGDFTEHTLTLLHLSHETDDAYHALWRFLLEMDLVRSLKAQHRSVDEPVVWSLSDRRGVSQSTWDHLWLRILDVPAALEARTYAREARCVLRVHDDLGFASGSYLLEVDAAGIAHVTPGSDADDGSAVVLPVTSLSALYLGGVSASTLAAAGLLAGSPESISILDSVFHSTRAPWLSIWF